MDHDEYLSLRKKRNGLRDKYNNYSIGLLVSSNLKKEIIKIDKLLSEYEKKI